MAFDAARFASVAIRLHKGALGTTQYGTCENKCGILPEPSAAAIDSQSVKTTEEAAADTRGYDSAKKIKGRKRHLLVDTLGLVLKVVGLSASIQDRDGTRTFFDKIRGAFLRLQKCGPTEVMLALSWASGSKPSVIGCWLGRNRRLSKDYERLIESSEAFVYIASSRLMTKRLAPA